MSRSSWRVSVHTFCTSVIIRSSLLYSRDKGSKFGQSDRDTEKFPISLEIKKGKKNIELIFISTIQKLEKAYETAISIHWAILTVIVLDFFP
jgi:hypothetical protein